MPSRPPQLTLIKAGAGAGKTTALVQQVLTSAESYYKEHNTFPRMAVAAFTRKASAELKTRLLGQAIQTQNAKLIDYMSTSSKLQVSTLHGLFQRFLNLYGRSIGLNPGLAVGGQRELRLFFVSAFQKALWESGSRLLQHYSFFELQDIIRQYMHYRGYEPNARPFGLPAIQKSFQNKLSEIALSKGSETLKTKQQIKWKQKLACVVKADYLPVSLEALGEQVFKRLHLIKKQTAYITYDDLEILMLELVQKKRPAGLDSFFDFWFLDEYQDTSPAQKQILDVLTSKAQTFVVGDPRQSIYYFRGADRYVFSAKEQQAKASPNGRVIKKFENFRSDSELIAFFNDFFEGFLKSSESQSEKMIPIRSQFDSKKEAACFIWIDGKASADTKRHLQVKEAAVCIQQLMDKNIRPENIAVLTKKNSLIGRTARYLKKQNIPVHLHSSEHFRRRREVKDALLLLRFLCNPWCNEHLVGLLRAPYWRIPDAVLTKWIKQETAPSLCLWDLLLKKEKQKSPPTAVVSVLKSYLADVKTIGVLAAFQKALEHAGLMDLAYYQDPTGVREANLWKLIFEFKKYQSKSLAPGEVHVLGRSHPLYFVDSLLEEDLEHPEEEEMPSAVSAVSAAGVQLMTIHMAKGLEFDHVILLDAGDGFKTQKSKSFFAGEKRGGNLSQPRWSLRVRSLEDDSRVSTPLHEDILDRQFLDEREEYKRLLYVALTRAKKTLTLIGAGDRTQPAKNSWPAMFPFFAKALQTPGLKTTPHYSTRSIVKTPSLHPTPPTPPP